MKDKICMGSRESRLAVIQTELVRDAVEREISGKRDLHSYYENHGRPDFRQVPG